MNDIDRKIQEALRQQSRSDIPTGDTSVTEEVLAAFRGRSRALSAIGILLQLAALAAFVWAVVRFLHAPDVTEQLRWAALGLVLFTFVSLIKIWFWLEMHSYRVLREVKRLELLLVSRPPH